MSVVLMRLQILLRQARDLRAQLSSDVETKQLAADDIRMKQYNTIIETAAYLCPGDPVLGKMVIMPDADLQMAGKWPLPNVPSGDRPHRRMIAYLDQFLGRLEIRLGETVASAHPSGSDEAAAALRSARQDANARQIFEALDQLRRQQSESRQLDARNFSFVVDADLRAVLEKDYLEAQRAFGSGANKGSALLSAGVIEGMLLDRLCREEVAADPRWSGACKDVPRVGAELDWDRVSLSHLVGAAVAMAFVSDHAAKLALGRPRRERHDPSESGDSAFASSSSRGSRTLARGDSTDLSRSQR